MKVWLGSTLAILLPSVCYGQGQVLFANKVGTLVDAPVIDSRLFPRGPGPGWTAQLLLWNADGSLTPMTPTSTFQPAGSGADAIADRYWYPQIVNVPGVPPGEKATFVVRAWLTIFGSFDTSVALLRGQTSPFEVTVGGGALPPANLTTLPGFEVDFIPEPSVTSLGALGAVLLIGLSQSSRR